MRSARILALLAAAVLLLAGCEREERRLRELPPATARPDGVRLSQLQPGPATRDRQVPAPFDRNGPATAGPYDGNAYGISEGKRLYEAFNCSGCHAHGGGDIGPPFLDETWIYGSDPENVFASIAEGRPNGMPAYGDKLPAYQIWQLASYVRSMGRLVPKAAASGRDDHLRARPSEQSLPRRDPDRPEAWVEPMEKAGG
jgi:cytochrome c oxidase cbb3-type subunit III